MKNRFLVWMMMICLALQPCSAVFASEQTIPAPEAGRTDAAKASEAEKTKGEDRPDPQEQDQSSEAGGSSGETQEGEFADGSDDAGAQGENGGSDDGDAAQDPKEGDAGNAPDAGPSQTDTAEPPSDDAGAPAEDAPAATPLPADGEASAEKEAPKEAQPAKEAEPSPPPEEKPAPQPKKAAAKTGEAVAQVGNGVAPQDGKTYLLRPAYAKDLSLDIALGSRSNRGNVQLYKANKTDAQRFTLMKVGNEFALMNVKSGKVVELEGGKTAQYTNISQYEYNGTAAQLFRFQKNDDGSYTLLSKKAPEMALDVRLGKLEIRANIWLYKANGTKAQRFILEEVGVADHAGTKMLRPKHAQALAVAPQGNQTAVNTNSNLQIAERVKLKQYTLKRVWGAFYTVTNQETGLLLTLKEKANGANVYYAKANGTSHQQWRVVGNSDGTISLFSRLKSDLALNIKDAGKKAGSNVQVNNWSDAASQHFLFGLVAGNTPEGISVFIASAKNTDRVFDIAGGSKAENANLQLYDYNATAAQQFTLVMTKHQGKSDYWYQIRTFAGKVLTVAGNQAASRTNIVQAAYAKKAGQLWHPVANGDGTVTFASALNEKLVIDIAGGKLAYGTNLSLYQGNGTAAQKWHLSSMKISKCALANASTVSVTGAGELQPSDDQKVYLFSVPAYRHDISGVSPIANAKAARSVTLSAALNRNTAASVLQNKFYLGVKVAGRYRIVSNAMYITNPEKAAGNTKAFPTPKRGTKKGLKMTLSDAAVAKAKELNCSHVVVDVPIEAFFYGSDYAYVYEGKTYYFSSAVSSYGAQIKKFNDAGIVVTGVFYLANKSMKELMLPSAASGSRLQSATIVAMNSQNANRKKLEALFSCLAERWSTNGITLANWIYGNELGQYNVYNYSGEIAYSLYHEALADSFRMFNTAIKSRWSNARTYISLDHNWNVPYTVAGTYNGMQLTANFNTDLVRQGKIHWDMAMHPYCSPEQDPRFWVMSSLVKKSGTSPQITMMNASYFAEYLEQKYGKMHIIMSETGISSVYNGTDMQKQQAAAVALAYYLAEFDSRIDMIGIHREKDEPGEVAGGWHLGLYKSSGSGFGAAKPSANVFKNMDTKNWNSATKPYLPLTGKSSWKELVPKFDGGRFK